LIKKLPPPTPDRYERRLFPPEHFLENKIGGYDRSAAKIAQSGTLVD
jgi:hypothetical protein